MTGGATPFGSVLAIADSGETLTRSAKARTNASALLTLSALHPRRRPPDAGRLDFVPNKSAISAMRTINRGQDAAGSSPPGPQPTPVDALLSFPPRPRRD